MTSTLDPAAVGSIDGVELHPRRPTPPVPPRHDDVAAERLHRKQRLAGALRVFGRLGFGEGVAGHITVRDPEHPDLFWVNPYGISFRHIRVRDLLLVDHDGAVLLGDEAVNPAAFVLHSAIHAARPEIVAAAHSHSVFGKAWSSLGRPLDPITQDACLFYEDHVVIDEYGGKLIDDPADGRSFAQLVGGCKAAIHRNHGLFTVGHSVDEAAFWYITMERSCQAQLLAEAAGEPQRIPHDWAVYTRDRLATPGAGWFGFQPLWQEICRTDPELFD